MSERYFYPLRHPCWAAAGMPGPTKAYELAKAGKLNLVRDGAGRTGCTRAEVERFLSTVEPIGSGKRGGYHPKSADVLPSEGP